MRLIRDKNGQYIFFCQFAEKGLAAEDGKAVTAGFFWNREGRYWTTTNARIALRVAAYADDALRHELIIAAGAAPDPHRAVLGLRDGVWRYYSPIVWNYPAKRAKFRFTREPAPHWFTEDLSAALACFEIAAELGDNFVCELGAQAVLKAEQSRRVQAVRASRAADADVNLPVPPGCELLPYQRAGVAYARDKDRVLFGDEQRLGKTPQSIVWLNCDPSVRRVLAIVPATVKLNWKRELEKWLTNGQTVGVAWGFDVWPKTDVVVINAEILYRQKDSYVEPVLTKTGKPKMKAVKGVKTPVTHKVYPLRKEIQAVQWDAVIADEGHRFKDDKTARYQCLSTLQPRKRAGLTGTPIPNRPVEIFPLLHWLNPSLFPDKWKFAMRYAGAKKGPFGWDLTGASNLGELQQVLRSNLMVRRLRSEVWKECPPKRRQLIEFPSPDDFFIQEEDRLWKRYTDLSALVTEAIKDSEVTVHVDDHREIVRSLETDRLACFEEMSRIRHEDAVKRIPFVVEHIKNLLEDEGKVICFAWHNDVVEQIAKGVALECDSVVIYGKTPQNQRVALQDRFNKDPKCRLCVISIAVCEGLDLSAASLGVMAEHDWVPKNIAQAEDRMFNPFKNDPVLIQYCVFENSLDARMAQTLVYKEEIAYDALDRELTGLAELQSVAEPKEEPVVLPAKKQASGPESPEEALEIRFAPQTAPSNGKTPQTLNTEACAAIHAAVRRLAGVCDGAFARDGQGFNAMDVRLGHSLALKDSLTPGAATLALSVLKKYRGQLNGELERFYE